MDSDSNYPRWPSIERTDRAMADYYAGLPRCARCERLTARRASDGQCHFCYLKGKIENSDDLIQGRPDHG